MPAADTTSEKDAEKKLKSINSFMSAKSQKVRKELQTLVIGIANGQ